MELSGDELEVCIKDLMGIGPRTANPVDVQQHFVESLYAFYYVMSNTAGLMGVCLWARTTLTNTCEQQAQEVLNQLLWEGYDVSPPTCIADWAVADIAVACG